MKYTATFKPSFFKDLKKIKKDIRLRAEVVIEQIIKDPLAVPFKKLAGHSNLFRYRLGDYRLVYYLQPQRKKIIFLYVAHRKDIYRKLKH